MPRSTIREFPAGAAFEAYNAARAWLKTRGFIAGSMQRGAPTGVHRLSEAGYISKWRNMTQKEQAALDGTIETLTGSYRAGKVLVRMSRRGQELIARYEQKVEGER